MWLSIGRLAAIASAHSPSNATPPRHEVSHGVAAIAVLSQDEPAHIRSALDFQFGPCIRATTISLDRSGRFLRCFAAKEAGNFEFDAFH